MNDELLSRFRGSKGINQGVYNIFFSLNVNNSYNYLIKNIYDFYIPDKKEEQQVEKELILKAPNIDPAFLRVINTGAFTGLIGSLIKNNIIDKSALVEERIFTKQDYEIKKERNYIQYPSVNNDYEMLEVKQYTKNIVRSMELFFNTPNSPFFKRNKQYKVSNIRIKPKLELVDINTTNPNIDNKVILKDGNIVFSPNIITYIPLLATINVDVKPVDVPSSLELLKIPTSKIKLNEYSKKFKLYKNYHCERNRNDFRESWSELRNKDLQLKKMIDIRNSFEQQVIFRFNDPNKSPFNLSICKDSKQKTIPCFDPKLEDIKDLTERNNKLFSRFNVLVESYKLKFKRCVKTEKKSSQLLFCLNKHLKNFNMIIRSYLLIWYKWNGIYNGNLIPNLIVSKDEFMIEIFKPEFELIIQRTNGKKYLIDFTREDSVKLIIELQNAIDTSDKIIGINFLNMRLNENLFNKKQFTIPLLKKFATLLNIPVFKSDVKSTIINKIINQIRLLKEQKQIFINFDKTLLKKGEKQTKSISQKTSTIGTRTRSQTKKRKLLDTTTSQTGGKKTRKNIKNSKNRKKSRIRKN